MIVMIDDNAKMNTLPRRSRIKYIYLRI